MHAIGIGEILWDVTPAGEFLGGAPFNFSYHLTRLGHQASFISAVGNDERGRRILERVVQSGISADFISESAEHPTGWADVERDSNGEPHFVIHRPAAYDVPHLDDASLHSLVQDAGCIYFGTLQQMSTTARELTSRLIAAAPTARRFYDPNLRKDSFTAELVCDLLSKATIVKLSEHEAHTIAAMYNERVATLEEFAHRFAQRFAWEAVAITRGENGCAVLLKEEYVEAAPPPVTAVDPVGAGDAFSAAFLHGIVSGWPSARIAEFANRVAALIVSRKGAVPEWSLAELKPWL
jgi:fructokinase